MFSRVSQFQASKQVACPGCKAPGEDAFFFKKDELVPTDGEDPEVKREIGVRHKVLKV